MPKTLYSPEHATRSGVDITFTTSTLRIDIGGWYDSMVGIEPSSMSLREFFYKLGITKRHCEQAFK